MELDEIYAPLTLASFRNKILLLFIGHPDGKIHNLSRLCLVENVDQIVGLNSRVSGKEEHAFNYQPNKRYE